MKYRSKPAAPRAFRRALFTGLLLAASVLAAAVGGYLYLRFSPFPELERFTSRPYSTVVTDRKGRILRTLPLEGGMRREYLSLDGIPSQVVEVFIASEDRRFFSHPGFDGFAAARSIIDAARSGRIVSGASTITMQLAGMIKPGERSLTGKIGEIIHSLRIESRLSKKEILELWMGSLPFGGQAEGIQSGSRSIFGVPADELNLPQALLLAMVPRRPADLNPGDDPDAAVEAALTTSLRLRLPVGEEELHRASSAARAPREGNPYEAPHFIEEALSFFPEAGAAVRTSLDLEIQHRVEGLVRYALDRYGSRRLQHAAAVVLDTRTGEILAYLGSGDYFSGSEGSMIDAVRVANQPGSCLKPLLYALALEEGYEPWNILPDVPLEFGGAEVYTPANFDNRFRGPVRFRVALASSLNIPAVYLLDQIGVERFAEFLISAGFPGSPGEIGKSGLGLALGNREVSLLDLTRAFSVFPRGGTLPELSYLPVLSPVPVGDTAAGSTADAYGDTAAAAGGTADRGRRIISRYTAGVICSILSDDSARIPGFGSVRVFETPFPAVFKTGTSNQFQDIWALGATPGYTVGVWMGNLTGETVIGRSGSSIPLGIARDILLYLHGSSGEPLPEPPGAAGVEVCAVTGKLAGVGCPAKIAEYTRMPPGRCTLHTVAGESGYAREGGNPEGDSVRIVRPADGAVYYYDPSEPGEIQAVRIEFRGGKGPVRISVNSRHEELKRVLPAGTNSWYLPLLKGVWAVAVSREGHTDSITIEVR